MNKLVLLVLAIWVCVVAIALAGLIVTWVIKCLLEWSDDIAYWYKEFKERHEHR